MNKLIKDLIGTKVAVKLPLRKYEFIYGTRSDKDYLTILTSQNRMFILDAEYNIKEVIE